MVKTGITEANLTKMQKAGIGLPELGKLISEPVSEEMIDSMMKADKDLGLLKEMNSMIK